VVTADTTNCGVCKEHQTVSQGPGKYKDMIRCMYSTKALQLKPAKVLLSERLFKHEEGKVAALMQQPGTP
jgi:hypothetical protein